MRKGILFVMLALLVGASASPVHGWKEHEDRRWIDPEEEVLLTPDKEAHFLGGIGWMVVGTDLLQEAGLSYRWSKALTFITGITGGVGKEYYYDAYRDGFSKVDVLFQFLGQGVAAAFFVHPRQEGLSLEPKEKGMALTLRW